MTTRRRFDAWPWKWAIGFAVVVVPAVTSGSDALHSGSYQDSRPLGNATAPARPTEKTTPSLSDLHSALLLGDFARARSLITPTIPTDGGGRTPLHYAAILGALEIANELLAAQPESVIQTDWMNRTPIYGAIIQGNGRIVDSVVERMLARSREMPQDVLGLSPLHATAIMESAEAARAIIREFPTSTKQSSQFRRTPLHYATMGGNFAMIGALVRGGADTNAADAFGNLPQYYYERGCKKSMEHAVNRFVQSPERTDLLESIHSRVRRDAKPLIGFFVERPIGIRNELLFALWDDGIVIYMCTTCAKYECGIATATDERRIECAIEGSGWTHLRLRPAPLVDGPLYSLNAWYGGREFRIEWMQMEESLNFNDARKTIDRDALRFARAMLTLELGVLTPMDPVRLSSYTNAFGELHSVRDPVTSKPAWIR